MSKVLELQGVSRHFGAVKAVDDVSLKVPAGTRHGLIGPNGAGKSTLFSLIAGAQPVSDGRIRYGDKDITGATMSARARMGIQQTFQHSKLFLPQTVRENVALAVRRARGTQYRFWRPASADSAVVDRAQECLEQVGLGERGDVITSTLSHGERRQLEVALLLAGEPELILLDEPTAGMSPAETASFVRLVNGLPDHLGVIIVEHDLEVVFGIAQEVSVLHLGRLIVQGTPEEVKANEAVQEAYLGSATEDELFTDTVEGAHP